MKLRGALLGLLALSACGRERPDPRLAEVQTPVHVTVRVIDVALEKPCEGTLVEQVSCLLTRAPRQGCVYAEAGLAAETPERRAKPDPGRCASIQYSAERALLRNEPVKKATLTVEPGGERVVVDLGDSLHALYLLDGELQVQKALSRTASSTRPDGTLDWSLVPPYLAVLDNRQLSVLTEARLDALLAKTPGGVQALTEALLGLAPSALASDEGWDLALSKLDEEGRRQVIEVMLSEVSEGNRELLQWFLVHEQEHTPALVAAIEDAMSSDSYLVPEALPALLKLDPVRAEQVACDQLEQRWHDTGPGGEAEYGGAMPLDTTVLAVIVSRKSKCPWVVPLLERDPCSWDLHCDPDVDERKPSPLCTEEQTNRVLAHTLQPSPEVEDAEGPEGEGEVLSDGAPLLLAAARIQGPLPPAFTRANERRGYTISSTVPGENEAEDPCAEVSPRPAQWACQLPSNITSARSQGCRMVVDDTAKTITLSAAQPDGGVPRGVPRDLSLPHR